MKNNKNLLKTAVILLLIVMIALVLVSGTYAKYTSNASGTDTARVAKWAFEINETKIPQVAEFTFDLFKTVNDTKDSQKETDVVVPNGSTDQIIAPGTEGSFDIKLENLSEVNAEYTINYTVTNTNKIPVEFSIDNGASWTADLAAVTATGLVANTGTDTITIQWKWAYEGGKYSGGTADDAYDTALGKDGSATITVKAEITVTQVD